MDSQMFQINVIEKSLAIAEEIYHQVECGIYCEGELADIIDKVRCNVEETASILGTEDLLRSKSIIENKIIKYATEYCEYFEKIKTLMIFLSECYDKFSAFGMATECEYVSMLCYHVTHGIRSSSELNDILSGLNWVTNKLGIGGVLHNTADSLGQVITESYYDSRRSCEGLKMALMGYVDILKEYRTMFERLLNDTVLKLS